MHYRIRVAKVGRYSLQVDARGEGVADAVRREIEVVPDGRRVEQVHSGTLQQPVQFEFAVPTEAIEGSVRALVKVYPSSFSQLVEGLDAIFQRPYGCFEQTSSTTYPNVLALDYLRRTGQSVPAVEVQARQYIHLGYQRLLGFEVSGGGFDWFGNPPANRVLTAYGLMEFTDMARVHDVDPALIERTRKWLLDQQRDDGSWEPESHGMHSDPARGSDARLATTAYLAWAVFGGRPGGTRARTFGRFPARLRSGPNPRSLHAGPGRQLAAGDRSIAPERQAFPRPTARTADRVRRRQAGVVGAGVGRPYDVLRRRALGPSGDHRLGGAGPAADGPRAGDGPRRRSTGWSARRTPAGCGLRRKPPCWL